MTDVRGTTRVAGVIGTPVRHSLSPVLHNAAFEAAGLDWLYVAFEVERGAVASALAGMRALGLGGMSVTMPHKTDAADLCDEVSFEAATLHSVNCVSLLPSGLLRGDSTDGEGFLRSLNDVSVDVSGVSVAVLGAGGAARPVALALARAGANVAVSARRGDASDAVAALDPSITTASWDDRDALVAAQRIVVNCTPLGMLENTAMPCSANALHRDHIVVDLVYRPLETPLLIAARTAGAQTVDGLGMLIHQAAIAFEIWTGVAPSIEAMRAAARATLLG